MLDCCVVRLLIQRRSLYTPASGSELFSMVKTKVNRIKLNHPPQSLTLDQGMLRDFPFGISS